jgi:hypothetical protein
LRNRRNRRKSIRCGPDIVEAERKAASLKMSAVSSVFTDAYDLKYNRFEWAVDPAVKYISGCVTSYFVPVGANDGYALL